MPKIVLDTQEWKNRPRIAIDPEVHRELKILCAKERLPIGVLADKIVSLGLEQWQAAQEKSAS